MDNRSLDIGRALVFMFEEEEWLPKFLIATGMVFFVWLIVPGLLLQGYMVEIIRRARRGEAQVLPVWDNAWGQYLREGFVTVLAMILYTLPLVLMICCTFLPFTILAEEGGELSGALVLLLCCGMGFIVLLQVAIFFVYFVGLVRYAEEPNLMHFFRFGDLFRLIRQHRGAYLYTALVLFVINVIGGLVPLFGQAWMPLAAGHILGQFLAVARDASPPAENPLEVPW